MDKMLEASTGPRSRERGNFDTGFSITVGEMLQRGRAHVSAEIAMMVFFSAFARSSFNGAALT